MRSVEGGKHGAARPGTEKNHRGNGRGGGRGARLQGQQSNNRSERVTQSVMEHGGGAAEPLAARGPHVVSFEHLDKALPQHPRNDCSQRRAERDSGQNEMRQPAASRKREPSEVERKNDHQERAEVQMWYRDAEYREAHRTQVGGATGICPGDHSQGKRDQDRDEKTGERELERGGKALADEPRDRLMLLGRFAEGAPHDAREEGQILVPERKVELQIT